MNGKLQLAESELKKNFKNSCAWTPRFLLHKSDDISLLENMHWKTMKYVPSLQTSFYCTHLEKIKLAIRSLPLFERQNNNNSQDCL